ncbi:MAG: hypothetical protein ACRC62_23820, partial [Microcoleus sp.]
MSNKYTVAELLEEQRKNLEARAKEFADKAPNPIQAIKDQAASLEKFRNEVTKNFGETRSLLDSAKAFLKDPKAEGTRIVKDSLKAADDFISKIVRALSKDVGTVIKEAIKGLISKITTNFDKLLKGLL